MTQIHRRRTLLTGSLAAALLAVLVLTAPPAHGEAKTFTVTYQGDTPDDNVGDGFCHTAINNHPCSLRAALQEARFFPGSTINVQAGVYTLKRVGALEIFGENGDLNILEDVTILGAGAGTTIVDASLIGDRVLSVANVLGTPTVTISGLTFRQGRAPAGFAAGGGIYTAGNLTLRDCVVTSNTSAGTAGGVFAAAGTLNLDNTRVGDNTAGTFGGGLYVSSGAIAHLTHATVMSNRATAGAGIYNEGTVTVLPGTVSNNETTGPAAGKGGGIYNAGSLDFFGGELESNTGVAGGGGLYNSGEAKLRRILLARNHAEGAGGGGVLNEGGAASLIVDETRVRQNSTPGRGGGIRNDAGALAITKSTVSDNMAHDGGGIFSGDGVLAITNSTISENTAMADGGGLWNSGPGTLTHVTITANQLQSVALGAAIRHAGPGALTLASSIVQGSCAGPLESGGANVADATCVLAGAGDVVAANPLLGPLTDNGGHTPTHALLAGSPALSRVPARTCAAADQRDVLRPLGNGCDAGAFESALMGERPPPPPLPNKLYVPGAARN